MRDRRSVQARGPRWRLYRLVGRSLAQRLRRRGLLHRPRWRLGEGLRIPPPKGVPQRRGLDLYREVAGLLRYGDGNAWGTRKGAAPSPVDQELLRREIDASFGIARRDVDHCGRMTAAHTPGPVRSA